MSISKEKKEINFYEYVRQIATESSDLTDAYVLLYSDKFCYLFKNMNLYVEKALEVLSNSKFSDVEKHVVLFAIQGLSLENILSFSEKMLSLLGRVIN